MTLTELLPEIYSLSRTDKLRLIQLLADVVVREENPLADFANSSIEIWSPYNAYEAAEALQRALDCYLAEHISTLHTGS